MKTRTPHPLPNRHLFFSDRLDQVRKSYPCPLASLKQGFPIVVVLYDGDRAGKEFCDKSCPVRSAPWILDLGDACARDQKALRSRITTRYNQPSRVQT